MDKQSLHTAQNGLNDYFAKARSQSPVVDEVEIGTIIDSGMVHGRHDSTTNDSRQSHIINKSTIMLGSIATAIIIGTGALFMQSGDSERSINTTINTGESAKSFAGSSLKTFEENVGPIAPVSIASVANDIERETPVLRNKKREDAPKTDRHEISEDLTEEFQSFVEKFWLDKINQYKRHIDNTLSTGDRNALDQLRVRWALLEDDERGLQFNSMMKMNSGGQLQASISSEVSSVSDADVQYKNYNGNEAAMIQIQTDGDTDIAIVEKEIDAADEALERAKVSFVALRIDGDVREEDQLLLNGSISAERLEEFKVLLGEKTENLEKLLQESAEDGNVQISARTLAQKIDEEGKVIVVTDDSRGIDVRKLANTEVQVRQIIVVETDDRQDQYELRVNADLDSDEMENMLEDINLEEIITSFGEENDVKVLKLQSQNAVGEDGREVRQLVRKSVDGDETKKVILMKKSADGSPKETMVLAPQLDEILNGGGLTELIRSSISADESESSQIMVETWDIADNNREGLNELKAMIRGDVITFMNEVEKQLEELMVNHADELPAELRERLMEKYSNDHDMGQAKDVIPQAFDMVYESVIEPMVLLYNGNDINDMLTSAIAEPVAGLTLNANSTLKQSYPNPTSSNATIEYSLQEASSATMLRLYDATGRVVREINLGYKGAGDHSEVVNLSEFSAGTYLYQLSITAQSGPQIFSKKLQVVN